MDRDSPSSQRAQAQLETEVSLLNAIPELARVVEIISCNSENFDGTGLLRGLKGDQIPLSGRILRLVDEYDRLVLPKASAPMSHVEVMRFLAQREGKQFDAAVLQILSQLTPEEINPHRKMNGGFGGYTEGKQSVQRDSYPNGRSAHSVLTCQYKLSIRPLAYEDKEKHWEI